MAFIIFGFTLWLALGERKKPNDQSSSQVRNLYPLLGSFLALLTLQIIYGAFVAGLDAGQIYNTFPKMGEHWIPDTVTGLKPLYLNFIESRTGVQLIHRFVAYLLLATAFYIWMKARKLPLRKNQKTALHAFLLVILLQAFLGVFTLLFAVPISLGVLSGRRLYCPGHCALSPA